MTEQLVDVFEWGEEFDPTFPIPGYRERLTERGIRVIELDVQADPVKRSFDNGAAFLRKARAKMTSESKFRRELLRDWSAGEGDIFFPEFMGNGGRQRYVVPIPHLLDAPIYRGWDFGHRAPACIWFQVDPKRRRVYVLRSLTPTFMGIHSFRDLVLYASGQAPLESLDRFGQAWVAALAADPTQPPLPWFVSPANKPHAFVDYGGWEAVQGSDMVKEETASKTRKEVLAESGIFLQTIPAATERITLLRKLLSVQSDGWPGIMFDPSNTLLIDGMAGGIVFKPPTPEDPLPDTYKKDGVHDNPLEALGYGIVGVVPLNEEKPPTLVQRWDENRRLVTEDDSASMFYEGRR